MGGDGMPNLSQMLPDELRGGRRATDGGALAAHDSLVTKSIFTLAIQQIQTQNERQELYGLTTSCSLPVQGKSTQLAPSGHVCVRGLGPKRGEGATYPHNHRP